MAIVLDILHPAMWAVVTGPKARYLMELCPKVALAFCADHDRRAFSRPLPLTSDKALAPALCRFIAVDGVQICELL